MDKPNVLIVMADQMTCALTGAYGHPVVRTPGLERLCGEGVRFDAAYSPCPLCAPARAAMFSGRYVSRTRTYDNGAALAGDVPTWAHHLRAAGYQTAAAGKLHFVGPDQHHGLEARLTPDIYPADFSWTPLLVEDCNAADATSFGKALGARKAGPCERSDQMTYDEQVHAASLEFLRGPRDGRPFCLLVSYTHPHEPYLAPQRFWDMYEGEEIALPILRDVAAGDRTVMDRWLHGFQGLSPDDAGDEEMMRTLHRAYYGMVSYVDEKIGQLLDTLDSTGLRETTAVFFVSDHGDMLGQRRLIEKRVFYEWSARVPLIASFPGHWPAGQTVDAAVGLVDLLPTLTELAGADGPADVDGGSLLPLIRGEDTGRERLAISEYHAEFVLAPCFMVRRGRYKYVYVHGHESRLYDLASDPDELNDLAGQPACAKVEGELHAAVVERFDVEAIAEDMFRSRAERLLMHQAMQQGRPTRWDYRP